MDKKAYLKILTFAIFSLALLAIIAPQSAYAATLYLFPSSGTEALGATFSVGVYVASAEQAMNAASGVISFPADKLEVTSLSKGGSIFTLWVQEPSFSNSAGTINFEGIVLNPGFTGASGRAITMTFRTKAAGAAPLTFSSGSILANDGQGTNILTGLGTAQFTIGGEAIAPPQENAPVETAVTVDTPAAAKIASPTHPDPSRWYSNPDPQFDWINPPDVTQVNVLANHDPNTDPGTRSDGFFSTYSYTDVDGGVWYFHLRLRNSRGWGDISHFKFSIDTQKPTDFELVLQPIEKPSLIREINVGASDETSGISHYSFQINGGEPITWRDDGTHKFVTPKLKPGPVEIRARVYDLAGNFLDDSLNFVVEKPPSVLDYLKIAALFIFEKIKTILSLFALLFLLALGGVYSWHKLGRVHRRLRFETKDAEASLHKVIELLKKTVREELKALERAGTKRELTTIERRITRKLEKVLTVAEGILKKEIRDVEKQAIYGKLTMKKDLAFLGLIGLIIAIGAVLISPQAATPPETTPCIQVVTAAKNPETGEIQNFPTPCDVPPGWEVTK